MMNVRALGARPKVVEVTGPEHKRVYRTSRLRTISARGPVLQAILRERFASWVERDAERE
jgi:hypothetical protein